MRLLDDVGESETERVRITPESSAQVVAVLHQVGVFVIGRRAWEEGREQVHRTAFELLFRLTQAALDFVLDIVRPGGGELCGCSRMSECAQR